MGFNITLCAVHTTQGQGTIDLYCVHPGPVPVPFPCSVHERSVIKHHREIADIVQKGSDLNFRTQYVNIFSCVISVASNVQILWTST